MEAVQDEGLVALLAGVVRVLKLTPEDAVVLAFSEDQGEFAIALRAFVIAVIGLAEFDTQFTGVSNFSKAVGTVSADLAIAFQTAVHFFGHS